MSLYNRYDRSLIECPIYPDDAGWIKNPRCSGRIAYRDAWVLLLKTMRDRGAISMTTEPRISVGATGAIGNGGERSPSSTPIGWPHAPNWCHVRPSPPDHQERRSLRVDTSPKASASSSRTARARIFFPASGPIRTPVAVGVSFGPTSPSTKLMPASMS